MPTLPSIPDQTAVIGSSFSYTLPEAVGGDLPITYELIDEPSWASVSNRVMSGTPDALGDTVISNGGRATMISMQAIVSFTLTVTRAVEVDITTAASTIVSEGSIVLNADVIGTNLTFLVGKHGR